LQELKQYLIPSLQERIKQLQKQNSSLKHEIAYYQEIEPYREEFYNQVTQIEEDLRKALSKLGRI
jgi:vacuolar-type H+-ATPase subunit I/STV1